MKALEQKKDIFWEFKNEDSPSVEFEIYADEFSLSTFILEIQTNDQK